MSFVKNQNFKNNDLKSNSNHIFGIISGLSCVAATGIGFGLSLPLLSFVMKTKP